MDILSYLLDSFGVGCHVGGIFTGAIAYADDLIFLSASVRHLKLLLDICLIFDKECDLVFNNEKSHCGVVGHPMKLVCPTVYLGNQILNWVNNFM